VNDWEGEQAAERARTEIWRITSGIWVFEHELAVNDDGAMVVAIGGGIPAGIRLAATLRNGEWVSYSLDTTNDLFLTRFKNGVLPRGIC
jgi:hypothetical protein